MIAHSASNINEYGGPEGCPRKYQAHHVTKEYRPTYDSPQAIRGSILHGLLEHTLRNGYTEEDIQVKVSGNKRLVSWRDYPGEWAVCAPIVDKFKAMQADGWTLKIEYEAACTELMRTCGWWADDCFARAKLDVYLWGPASKGTPLLIWDWKTGKGSSINPFQLPFIALVLSTVHGPRKYGAVDFLIDQGGKLIQSSLETKGNLIQYLSGEVDISMEFMPLITAMRDLENSYKTNNWPMKKSYKCQWCEVPGCPNR